MLDNVVTNNPSKLPPNRRPRIRQAPAPSHAPIGIETPPAPLEAPERAVGGTHQQPRKTGGRSVDKHVTKKPKKCRHCRKSFRGFARRVFCSDNCRSAHHKAAKRAAEKREAAHLEMCECVHCGRTYLSAHKARLYCGKNCRNKASEARRDAAIIALALHFKRSAEWGADYVDSRGMKKTGKALTALGYAYHQRGRAWIPALAESA